MTNLLTHRVPWVKLTEIFKATANEEQESMYSHLGEGRNKLSLKLVCQAVLRCRKGNTALSAATENQTAPYSTCDLPEAFPSPDPVSPNPNFFFFLFVNSFPALLLIPRSKMIFTINSRFSQNAFSSIAWVTTFFKK